MSLAEELFAAVPDFILIEDELLPDYLREQFSGRLYLWRIDTPTFLETFRFVAEGVQSDSELFEFAALVLSRSLGDEEKPGILNSSTGLNWIRRQPQLIQRLATFALEFNGLGEGGQKKG